MAYILNKNPNSRTTPLKTSKTLNPEVKVALSDTSFDAHFYLSKSGKIESIRSCLAVECMPKEEFCDSLPSFVLDGPKHLLQLKHSGVLVLEREAQAQSPLGLIVDEDSTWVVFEFINSTERMEAGATTYAPLIWVKTNGKLKHIRYYLHQSSLNESEKVYIDQNGNGEFFNFHFGKGKDYKTNFLANLLGRNASVSIRELNILRPLQSIVSNITVEHYAPQTSSSVLLKNIVLSKGFSSFDGLVRIRPEAENSTAEQKNYNLLTDDSSRSVSIPNLDIQNQNVRCTHGTATQHLDDEVLFYMNSRGIDKISAQELFVEGFAEAVFEQIPSSYQEQCRTLFQNYFC